MTVYGPASAGIQRRLSRPRGEGLKPMSPETIAKARRGMQACRKALAQAAR